MDLFPLIDSDCRVDKEDFVPGILQLYEKDGTRYPHSIALNQFHSHPVRTPLLQYGNSHLIYSI